MLNNITAILFFRERVKGAKNTRELFIPLLTRYGGIIKWRERGRERERERERETERETDRQTDRQTETETDRQTQTDRQTDREDDHDLPYSR